MTRVPIQLNIWDMEWAEDIATEREKLPRNARAKPVGNEGYETHLQGAMGEIAAAKFYGVELDPVTDGRDPGWDLCIEVDGFIWTLQIKATPYFKPGIKLFAMPHEMHNAHAYLLCAVNIDSGWVELVGTASTKHLWSQPLGRISPNRPLCRWLTEDQLRTPRSISVR